MTPEVAVEAVTDFRVLGILAEQLAELADAMRAEGVTDDEIGATVRQHFERVPIIETLKS
jgi:hypothetical protein